MLNNYSAFIIHCDYDFHIPLKVVMGGGRKYFFPKGMPDPEEPDEDGRRRDNRNLVEVCMDTYWSDCDQNIPSENILQL